MTKQGEEAKSNPILVMIAEQTGDKYARAVSQKGVGANREMDWLIKDMVEELKGWGHTGGSGGDLIMKNDHETAIEALRASVGKLLGGRVIPEHPPRGRASRMGESRMPGNSSEDLSESW